MNKPGLAARLRAAFLADLEEQLATLNVALLTLEVDPASADALKAVFRVMHTLKGAAHATDQPLVERACHHLEALLVEARDGRLALGRTEFTQLFAAADALTDTQRRLANGEDVSGDTPLGRLAASLEGSDKTAVHAATPDAVAPQPPTPSAMPPVVASDGPLTEQGASAAAGSTSSESAVRVSADKLDGLLSQVGRLLATRARITEHAQETLSIQTAVQEANAAVRRLLALYSAHLPLAAADGIRAVAATLRDANARVGSVATHTLDDGRELAEVGDALADSVRRVRMLPFSSACEVLPRLVRDVATDTGRPTRLVVLGGEVEADRPVLDALKDSLLHLVRNAVDHGIEPQERRKALGKPGQATVTVRAALHGELLTVQVSDDGSGLDIPAIRAKLAERGKPVPDTDEEVARTLFEAGFSTRDVASTISGRGVGLDAVETEQELVVRPIARARATMPHVSGGALLGSGHLVLVLNPVSLVQQASAGRLAGSAAPVARKRMRVLVADDSMTTRALEQSVLEAAGYEVTTAVDGADAWRQLQAAEVDLVVTDIEMPNMDGLSLCRAIRGSQQFANLPVVLVTSLDNPGDRARGMSAGADAYVGKAVDGQAGLLVTVRELLA